MATITYWKARVGSFYLWLFCGVLQHSKGRVVGGRREDAVDRGDVFGRKLPAAPARILADAVGVRRLGNREDIGMAGQEVENDLARRPIVPGCDFGQHPAARSPPGGKFSMAERRVGDYSDLADGAVR